jgi:hypothetical protein
MRRLAFLPLAMVCAMGCSTSDTSSAGGSAGASPDASVDGTAGLGGSAGSGGGGGSAGNGAAAGKAGSGGSAGSAGQSSAGSGGADAGQAGQGGTSGSGPAPQCTLDTDCTLINDCCYCMPYVKGATPPDCSQQCDDAMCEQLGVQGGVKCVAGQCVLDIVCKPEGAVCASMPPACTAGKVPTVVGSCWGKCVKASFCPEVAGCDVCGDDEACVAYAGTLGDQKSKYHCATLPIGCSGHATCACMGTSVCVGSFDLCVDQDAGSISCDCPAC